MNMSLWKFYKKTQKTITTSHKLFAQNRFLESLLLLRVGLIQILYALYCTNNQIQNESNKFCMSSEKEFLEIYKAQEKKFLGAEGYDIFYYLDSLESLVNQIIFTQLPLKEDTISSITKIFISTNNIINNLSLKFEKNYTRKLVDKRKYTLKKYIPFLLLALTVILVIQQYFSTIKGHGDQRQLFLRVALTHIKCNF